MAAILDFTFILKLDNVILKSAMLPDHDNMSIAVGILLHACVYSDACVRLRLVSIQGRSG